MQTVNHIHAAAEQAATEFFTPEYIREADKYERQEQGLGIAISQWSEWDGLKILRVFRSALEDSNFHTEAAQVEEMIKKVEAE